MNAYNSQTEPQSQPSAPSLRARQTRSSDGWAPFPEPADSLTHWDAEGEPHAAAQQKQATASADAASPEKE